MTVVVDTGAFIAGVGILAGLDVLSITFLLSLAQNTGTDQQARESADAAHSRLTNHLKEYHGEDRGGSV